MSAARRLISSAPMLLAIALAYVVALLAPWDLGPFPAIAALSLALFFVGYGAELRAKLWVVPLSVAALFAGLEKPPASSPAEPPAGLARVDAEVLEVRHAEAGVSAKVRVLRGQGVGHEARFSGVALRVRGLDLPPGTRARFVARVQKPSHFENPVPRGVVSLEPAWARGAALVGSPRVLEPAGPVSRAIHGLRAVIRRGLVEALSPEAAGVARALSLGEGAAVDRGARDAIRDAGLSHVLAVSGLHVGLVCGGLYLALGALLRRLGWFLDPARAAAGLAIAPSLAFALVAGGSPSAIRAGAMLALALFCRAAGRRPRALSTLGGAMMAFALVSPEEVSRPAFLLSVLATMSILTMPAPRSERWKALEVSWQLAYRTTLATAPVVLLYFRAIPLSGLASNLVLVPVASLGLIPLALAQSALGVVGLGGLTAPLFELTVAAFTAAARAFASLGLDLRPPPLTVLQLVAVSGLALACLVRIPVRPRAALAVACLALGLGDEARVHLEKRLDERLRVTVLDVGQGSAAVIELPRGEGAIVADAGTDRPDTGARVVVPFLEARRYREVKLFLASHAHPDHVGGLASLAEALPTRELWAPLASSGRFARTVQAMRGRVRVHESARDGCLTRRFGEVVVETVAPCPGDPLFRDENEDSLVVRVTLGQHSVLLPGDAEKRREAALVRTRPERLRATLLVAAHHGSKTSSAAAFVRAVRPEVVFVSAGRMSRFGHPHEGPMRRFAAAGARAWVTSRRGGLTFETDGRSYAVRASEGPEDGERDGEEGEDEDGDAQRADLALGGGDPPVLDLP